MDSAESNTPQHDENMDELIEFKQNRDFTASIEYAMRKCVDFLNDFHESAQYRLSSINSRLTSLERKLDFLEAQMANSLCNVNLQRRKTITPIPFEMSIFNPSVRNKLNQQRLKQQKTNQRRYNEMYTVGPWPKSVPVIIVTRSEVQHVHRIDPRDNIKNQIKRYQNTLTVHGYTRLTQIELNMHIPPEIVVLLVVWYHEPDIYIPNKYIIKPPPIPSIPPGPPPVPRHSSSFPVRPPPFHGPPPVPRQPPPVPTVPHVLSPPLPLQGIEEDQLKRENDALLVYGYIHCNEIIQHMSIPPEIIDLFATFYHIPIPKFPHYDKKKIDVYVVDDTKTSDTRKPNKVSTVDIGYVGYLCIGVNIIENTKQFIEHREVIQLGKKQNIKGLEQALVRMTCGQKIKLWIPSKLAYAKRGAAHIIPPNCDLLFDLTLHNIIE